MTKVLNDVSGHVKKAVDRTEPFTSRANGSPSRGGHIALHSITRRTKISLGATSGIVGRANHVASTAHRGIRGIISQLNCHVGISTHGLGHKQANFVALTIPYLATPCLTKLTGQIVSTTHVCNCSICIAACTRNASHNTTSLLHGFGTAISSNVVLSLSRVRSLAPRSLSISFPLIYINTQFARRGTSRIAPSSIRDTHLTARCLLSHNIDEPTIINSHASFTRLSALHSIARNGTRLHVHNIFRTYYSHGVTLTARLVPGINRS